MVQAKNPLKDTPLDPQNYWSSAAELWLQSLELMTTCGQPAKQMREQWWQYTFGRWDEINSQWRTGLDLYNSMEEQFRQQAFETCRQMIQRTSAS